MGQRTRKRAALALRLADIMEERLSNGEAPARIAYSCYIHQAIGIPRFRERIFCKDCTLNKLCNVAVFSQSKIDIQDSLAATVAVIRFIKELRDAKGKPQLLRGKVGKRRGVALNWNGLMPVVHHR